VLSTDVANHYRLRSNFDNYFIKYAHNTEKWHNDDQAMESVRGMVLHFADHSMLAKKSSLALEWYDRYQRELFAQGDAEMANYLPISPLCDRQTPKPKIAAVVIGLLDFVVQPLLCSLSKLSVKMDDELVKHVAWNREMWARKEKENFHESG